MSLRANRDFRLLLGGRSVSLLGDGAFLVALAWEAYTLSNAPTALSLIGVAMTVPTISLLLFGGVVSDRYRRRTVMLMADALRAVLLLLTGALALAGDLGLWQLVVIVAFYGAAQAFFDPASDAILPEIVGPDHLGQANALEQLMRPLTLRLIGPALGGVLVGTIGSGAAFMADGASFIVSALTLWLMASSSSGPLAPAGAPAPDGGSAVRQVLEGWAYVRHHVWLWGTFASAGIAYLLFMGPSEVLLPFMVKHELHGSGVELGLVFGAGGLGAVGCAVTIMRGGMPSNSIAFIYSTWTLATLAVAGYGLANAVWQLMLASLAFNLLETGGTIVWATLKQRLVPGRLLGRVSSLDWLISIGLLPVSFALTAPVSAVLGVRATLVAAGVAGAMATLGGLLLPGMRASEDAAAPHASAGAPV
jgi:DHA3 family tetracycline resistance protein-like MFS transporter